jgi:DMSO/TMAO reductase YedYZ molybdopterin-dependent catalytic subunit
VIVRRRGGRLTNVGLFALLAVALGTGAAAFAVGVGWVRWVTIAHGIAGFGLLLLVPWKWPIVRRGTRRRGGVRAAPAAVFGLLIVVSLAAGAAHSTGLWRTIGPFTAMQVHVGAALAAVPFAIWHVFARPVKVRRTDLSRRTLLRAGGVAAGSVALYGLSSGVIDLTGAPGSRRHATGSFERTSGPTATADGFPVTQWLFDPVPAIDPASWRVTVVGRNGQRAWTFDEIDALREPVTATIDCTGGWYSTRTWDGVRVDRLVEPARARSVVVTSHTGYARRFSTDDATRLWVASRVDGVPLSAGHGFPARLVAPGRRGFWWVKWVTRIEASDEPWWWQSPFPLR